MNNEEIELEKTNAEFINWLAVHFMTVVIFLLLFGGVYVWLW